MIRDFECKGIHYHLNDNSRHNEFEGKYTLMVWREGYGKWISVGTVDTKKEALKMAKEKIV